MRIGENPIQTKNKNQSAINSMNLAQIVIALALSIAQTETTVAANVRSVFDALPRLSPRRRYGRTTDEEREAFKLFFKHGITREEIAVKFAVTAQTVYNYTGANFPWAN